MAPQPGHGAAARARAVMGLRRRADVSVMDSRHVVTPIATAVRMRHASLAASRRSRHARVRHFGEQYTESVRLRTETETPHTGHLACPHRISPPMSAKPWYTAR